MAKKSKKNQKQSKNQSFNFEKLVEYAKKSFNYKIFLAFNTLVFFAGIYLLIVKDFDFDVWKHIISESNVALTIGLFIGTAMQIAGIVFSYVFYLSDEVRKRNNKIVPVLTNSPVGTIILVALLVLANSYKSNVDKKLHDDCYAYQQIDVTNLTSVENSNISVLVTKFKNADEANVDPQYTWSVTLKEYSHEIQVDNAETILSNAEDAKKIAECLKYDMVIYGGVSPSSGDSDNYFSLNLPDSNMFPINESASDFSENRKPVSLTQLDDYHFKGNGTSVYALNFLKALLAIANQDDDAIDYIDLAIELAPSDLAQQRNLGVHYLLLLKAELTAYDTGSYYNNPLVRPILDQAEAIDPEYYYLYYLKGWLLHYSNIEADLQLAIDYLSQAIGEKDDFAFAYQVRATSYIKAGQLQLALDDINIAISLEPDNPLYMLIKGNILNDMHNYAESISLYNQVQNFDGIEIGSTIWCSAQHNKANIYLVTSDLQKAIESYEALLNNYRGFEDVRSEWDTSTLLFNTHFGLAQAYDRSGDSSKAVQHYRIAIDSYQYVFEYQLAFAEQRIEILTNQ